jgi:hypothetical protein
MIYAPATETDFEMLSLAALTRNAIEFMMMPARSHSTSSAATSASKESVTGTTGDEVSGPREDDGTGSELIVTAAEGPGEEFTATVTFTSEADEAMDVTELHCSQRKNAGDISTTASRMPHSSQKARV